MNDLIFQLQNYIKLGQNKKPSPEQGFWRKHSNFNYLTASSQVVISPR